VPIPFAISNFNPDLARSNCSNLPSARTPGFRPVFAIRGEEYKHACSLAETALIAFETALMAFETALLAFETALLAFETALLAFETALLAHPLNAGLYPSGTSDLYPEKRRYTSQ
jgi:hypothetical protein